MVPFKSCYCLKKRKRTEKTREMSLHNQVLSWHEFCGGRRCLVESFYVVIYRSHFDGSKRDSNSLSGQLWPRPWNDRFLTRSSCLRMEWNCPVLCMAYDKSRAGSARRKSEASSRKRSVSLSRIFFFHAADYVTAFVIAPYHRIYIAGSVNAICALRYFFRASEGNQCFFFFSETWKRKGNPLD